ncbi:hypothetical protein AABB24_011146 [Solanum stoloniferum]|uniref:Uncharacterized protein n=2 Tax=Solanum TaxID=4107 RepID=A0AAF0R2B3_SOLVR|nr:uncharacterized protein LOC125828311 [Solanum verrucosum]WMV34947.1 hypothetical protein MTR67_028332 [Solanum verrucosum]
MQYPQATAAPERACARSLVVFSPKIITCKNRQPASHFCSTKFGSALPSGTSLSISRRANHSAAVRASSSSFSSSASPWDEKPYQVLPNGKIVYLDEQDVVTFLDPPMELIPLDPSSYNPAFYLWKKIEDIPEERRHRLLALLNPRLISQAWEIAGTRYNNSKLVEKSASSLLATGNSDTVAEFWKCRTSGGPLQIAWLNFFKKVVFYAGDGKTYGRLISESVFSGLSNSFSPLYFMVNELKEVMSTEEPCDLAYEFKDGILDLPDFPHGFPMPAEHPWPFNDEIVIYIRHAGPGVMVGQAWQEGKALQQVPKKLCSEILMVKEYLSSQPQSAS